jgi:hypothetical protein
MNNERMKGYPKYQYSVFIKNGKDQQLVIRTETFEELVEAKKNIDMILEKSQETTEKLATEFVKTPAVSSPEDTVMCVMHGEKMPMRISKAGNAYWKHSRKVGENWESCFGKGWKS